MIRLIDSIWVGCRRDLDNRMAVGICGVLNVAQDLGPDVSWPEVEYAQVGLVDGPGNETADYCAALFVLSRLRRRRGSVLVYDHDGSRAVAVGAMYLGLILPRDDIHPTCMPTKMRWDDILARMSGDCGLLVPYPHEAHREAFERLPFGLLEAIL